MIEYLSTNLLWWHWIAFGLALLTLEIFSGTFIMLGLGLAAIIVGAIDVFYPISIEMELTIWLLLSVVAIALWFKYMKDNRVETSGQSNYSLETLGTVTQEISKNGRGHVRFDTPVLGNTTWAATSKEDLKENTRIKIVEVKGQLIVVASL
jgi:membrane protein implicated in regulation of membrane protease activity